MSNTYTLPAGLPDTLTDAPRAKAGAEVLIKEATTSAPRKPANKVASKQKAAAVRATTPGKSGIFGDVPDLTVCEEAATLPLTRMGLAQRIHLHYGDHIAYRPSRGSWWLYADGVWTEDDVLMDAIIRRVIRSVTVFEASWAERKSEDVSYLQARIDALIAYDPPQEPTQQERDALRDAKKAARYAHERYGLTCENGAYAEKVKGDLRGIVSVSEDRWDEHPFRINFPNGTINIGADHRGPDGLPVLTEHDPLHYITSQTAVDYDPEAWSDDLDAIEAHMELTGPGTWKALTYYLGYGLTGDMLAKTYLNLWSPPDGAKSTLMDAVFEAIGGLSGASYAGVLDPVDLSVSKAEAGKTQPGLDALRGKRLVFIHEAQHVHLGSDLVKRWTGGDAIRTRTLNAPGGVWQPEGKLVLIGNGVTPFTASDKGMVDRAFIIATQALPVHMIDRQLRHRIGTKDGQRAVLAMLVKAACEWYDLNKGGAGARDALSIPAHCEKSKAEALVTINPLSDWIEAALTVGNEDDLANHPDFAGNIGRCTTGHLCIAYNEWAKPHGLPTYSPRKFGPLLTAAGLGETADTDVKAPTMWNTTTIKVKGLIRLGVRLNNRTRWERIVTGQ